MGCGGTGGGLPGLLPLDNKDSDDDVFRPGDIEDEYEVEKEPIARGKFASVRLARHRVTREIFAAKFIRRRRRAANLEQEARHEVAVLMLGRSAPHIVHLHQVFETRAEYIIILEFGEGGDLQRLLDDQGRLSEKTVQNLLRQVLKGLEFLHQQNVAHLDIKPQNLVLMGATVEDGVKLVDFGLSRVIHRDAELTQIMGTPDYVAPEIINFEAVGLATDLWSIGVLTYVLLTGYTPFGGDTDQETFVNITQGDFDFSDEYFSDVTEQAKDFISGLLIKSTNQRMTVSQCVAHPWLFDLFDPHRLSQLSEADSADSGYSTDLCSGSPPSPGTLPNGFVSDLCQYSIPEDQQVSTLQPIRSHSQQFRPHHLHPLGEDEVDRGGVAERRPRLSSAHMSINVLECLQAQQRQQSRPLRRSSLIIPRYSNDFDSEDRNETPFLDLDENQNTNGIYSSDHYGLSNLNAWNNSPHTENSTKNQPDQNDLLSIAMPWNNLCNGSYNRAINQLKSPLPKKAKIRTNLGMRPELSCSMFELQPNYDNTSCYADVRPSKHELKKSKSEMRCLKKDLRGHNFDTINSRSDFWNTRGDLRDTPLNLKTKNLDHRSSITDVRCSKIDKRNSHHESKCPQYDLRNSKSEMRIPRPDLQVSKSKSRTAPRNNLVACHNNFASIPYLNMSMSQLNIAHETLDNEESEERDVVYADCTLPRRFSRNSNNNSVSPMLRGNSFHMSFRRPKKRDSKM